jgi:hypothetical protein
VAELTRLDDQVRRARALDLSSVEGCFGLGDLIAELREDGLPDPAGRLAADLDADRQRVVDAWYVAGAFPSATRRPGLPWELYVALRFHPHRHELAAQAAREHWSVERLEQELAARFAARHPARAAG